MSLPGGARAKIWRIPLAVAAMAVAVVLFGALRSPEPPTAVDWSARSTGAPIPSEAGVFRTTPGNLAAGATGEPRAGARMRTLARFRAIRAFPGAPPSVPHALSAAEFLVPSCNSCHEKGGYTARFGAYAPVTPHPELRNCLQCHAVNDAAVDAAAGARVTAAVGAWRPIDWTTTAWPLTGVRALEGSPPVIPHTLAMRGNCLACHAGAGAVAEIRTSHPGQANCRQCHVPSEVPADALPDGGVFRRPARAADAR